GPDAAISLADATPRPARPCPTAAQPGPQESVGTRRDTRAGRHARAMRILATCCAALVLLAVAPVPPAARAPRAAETVAVELAVVRASRERVELFGEAAPRFIPPLPVPLALHRGFERPPDRWAPGHRGIDL